MVHDYVVIIGLEPLINLCDISGIAHNGRSREELG